MSAPTEEELRKMFPNAPESFIRRNAGVIASVSAISHYKPGRSGGALGQLFERIQDMETVPDTPPGRQIRTVREENPTPPTLLLPEGETAPESSISLILPYPPSANNYWRSIISKGRVLVLVSSEAKHYKRAIAIIAKAKCKAPLSGPLVLTLHLYRPQKSGDLSNRIKVLEDALQGICYENDSQIVSILAYRHDDKDNPRAELEITRGSCGVDDSQQTLTLEP